MQSIYWVITRNCTQRCSHCYIASESGGESLSLDDAERIVHRFPEQVNQVIIGGGETLLVKSLLYKVLDALYAKFGDGTRCMIQTNGDLLNERTVEELLEYRVCGIDVFGMDEFHNNRHSREELGLTLRSKGVKYLEFPNMVDEDGNVPIAAYSFWGATPDLWLGGVWPRGRAVDSELWTRKPSHDFCDGWSGALGFLDDNTPQQEINVRLSQAFPCCPATKVPLGDLREEPVLDILDQYRDNPVFRALNRGEPDAMGVAQGITVDIARKRIDELGSCCLWCDEFFGKYYRE